MLTTLEPEGTKSTVTASPPLGTDRVAVSPVCCSQSDQQRPGPLAHVELAQHPVRQRHQPQSEPVRATAGRALDQPGVLERGRPAAMRCWR